MEYSYITDDRVCSKEIIVEIENNIIKKVRIIGGCPGNTFGLSKIVIGMNADEVVNKLKGTQCGNRGTSCPDQLAIAIERAKENF